MCRKVAIWTESTYASTEDRNLIAVQAPLRNSAVVHSDEAQDDSWSEFQMHQRLKTNAMDCSLHPCKTVGLPQLRMVLRLDLTLAKHTHTKHTHTQLCCLQHDAKTIFTEVVSRGESPQLSLGWLAHLRNQKSESEWLATHMRLASCR